MLLRRTPGLAQFWLLQHNQFMKPEWHYRKASGFSLVELVLVIAAAAVLLGIAAPSFFSWLPAIRLSAAAHQVATDLQVARMRAISRNASTTVAFNPSGGTYSYGADSRSLPTLYPGITIASVSSDPIFSPRGTANEGVTITLSNGSAQKRVCVKTVGRVNIADASCG